MTSGSSIALVAAHYAVLVRSPWKVTGAGMATLVYLVVAGPCWAASSSPVAHEQVDTTSPLIVAKQLALSSTDLPRGWASDDQAGRCMVGKGYNPAAPYCGNAPLPSWQTGFEKFAACVGVPVSQIPLVAGWDEPGEPFTYSSSGYTAPGPPGANPDFQSHLQSALMIEMSASEQEKDLAAFSKPSFPVCFKILESGPMFALIREFIVAEHGTFSFGGMHRVAEPARAGVTTMGYEATMNLRSPRLSISETSTWVLFGAGRVEEVLELGSTSRARLPAAVADTALAHLEKRLAAYVAG